MQNPLETISLQNKAIDTLKLISQSQTKYLQEWIRFSELQQKNPEVNRQLKSLKNTQYLISKKKSTIDLNNHDISINTKIYNNKKSESEQYIILTPRKIQFANELIQQIKQEKKNKIRYSTKFLVFQNKIKNKTLSNYSNYQQQPKHKQQQQSTYTKKTNNFINYFSIIKKLQLFNNNKQVPKVKSKLPTGPQIKKCNSINIIKSYSNQNHINSYLYNTIHKMQKNSVKRSLPFSQTTNQLPLDQSSKYYKQGQMIKTWIGLSKYRNKRSSSSIIHQSNKNKYMKNNQDQVPNKKKSKKLLSIIQSKVECFS